jgi:hypothetical protein
MSELLLSDRSAAALSVSTSPARFTGGMTGIGRVQEDARRPGLPLAVYYGGLRPESLPEPIEQQSKAAIDGLQFLEDAFRLHVRVA